jgi:hypothetical protein
MDAASLALTNVETDLVQRAIPRVELRSGLPPCLAAAIIS